MTMFLQLLVAAVTVGLSAAEVPPYKEYVQAIHEAAKTIEKNVLSMEGHIPLLNDSRRHYAEIVHVINYHAKERTGCIISPYYEVYYSYLNTSAPEAISNPELVVAEVRDLLDEIHNNTNKVIELIDVCLDTPSVCNQLINDTINKNQDEYGHQAKVLIAAGNAATEWNKLNKKFEEISNLLKANKFVCRSPRELEHIVETIAQLHRSLHPLRLQGCY